MNSGMEMDFCSFPATRRTFAEDAANGVAALAHKAQPAARQRVLLWHDEPMAWPFLFDAERPLSSGAPGHHWHRYETRACNGSLRHVHGAVAESAAQIYFAALLKNNACSSSEKLAPGQARSSWSPELLVCAECPVHACCPWPAPTPQPAHSLAPSAVANAANTWPPLENLTMSGCARSV